MEKIANKRDEQKRATWIKNVKAILGYSQEHAESEFNRIFIVAPMRSFDATTKGEMEIFRDTCIASYRAELTEIQSYAPNIGGFFYSEHRGSWVLQFYRGDDEEFDTKVDLVNRISDESNQD
jgi:hypothetical protein